MEKHHTIGEYTGSFVRISSLKDILMSRYTFEKYSYKINVNKLRAISGDDAEEAVMS